jgi:hypothetical protein
MFDFTFSELRDRSWLMDQPKGTVGTYLAPKGDSGGDSLSLAIGEGVDGDDCLVVTSPNPQAGLPGFWVLRGVTNGKAIANCKKADGYILDGEPVMNRMSFHVRFDDGFRAKSSASRPHNFVIGTYHFDPAKIGRQDVKESDNWHFYHQLRLRHDLAKDGWIRVVVNDVPQHQRSRTKGNPVPCPTSPASYYNSLTRFYLDCTPYMSDAEIPHPVRMFVDRLEFSYVPPPPVRVDFRSWAGKVFAGLTSRFPFTLTNETSSAVTGTIAHRSHYAWTPALTSAESAKSLHKSRLTLNPHESREFMLEITPRQASKAGSTMLHGIVFVPENQDRPRNASLADVNVELDQKVLGYSGPCDASIASSSIQLTIG